MLDSYIKYLDLPTIPKELASSAADIINLPLWGLNAGGGGFHKNDNYSTRKLTSPLRSWLSENLNFEFVGNYIVFNGPVLPHKDMRQYACNYIVDPGGDDIRTTVWDGQLSSTQYNLYQGDSERQGDKVSDTSLTELQSMVIEPFRWHSLRTDLFHSVTGNFSQPRVLISITPSKYLRYPTNEETLEKFKVWLENWNKD